MKYINAILALASASTAIDSFVHIDSVTCEGRFTGCVNLNPNVCCRTEGGFSARFDAMPTNWNIETRIYQAPNCDESRNQRQRTRGVSRLCRRPSNAYYVYTTGYGFYNARMMAVGASGDQKECVNANVFGLGDGTMFNLTAMTSEEKTELYALEDVKVQDVPESLTQYQMWIRN